MPSDLAELMISQGIKSCLIFPLQEEYNLFGFIGFDDCNEPKEWDKLEVELLKTIANLISFSYEREKTQYQLERNEQHFRELTDMLPHIVFEVSLTGRLEFLNQTGCKYFNIKKGDLAKGILLRKLFPETEIFLMSVLRDRLIRKESAESIRLEAKPINGNGQVLQIWATPKHINSKLIGFSGIALLENAE
jgi:PAS domain-containing protein